MFDNIKPIPLHCVFHGIRFKVNKDWLSGIDSLLFFIYLSHPYSPLETGSFLHTFGAQSTKNIIFAAILNSNELQTKSHCTVIPPD